MSALYKQLVGPDTAMTSTTSWKSCRLVLPLLWPRTGAIKDHNRFSATSQSLCSFRETRSPKTSFESWKGFALKYWSSFVVVSNTFVVTQVIWSSFKGIKLDIPLYQMFHSLHALHSEFHHVKQALVCKQAGGKYGHPQCSSWSVMYFWPPSSRPRWALYNFLAPLVLRLRHCISKHTISVKKHRNQRNLIA